MPNDVVRLWFSDLRVGAEELRRLCELLSPQELSHAERFRFPELRRRFIVAHAFLRQVIGSQLDIEPASLEFWYAAGGRPGVANGCGLQFNLSHSRDIAALAVARQRRVGVDVEVMRDDVEFEDIARRFFCASEAKRVVSTQGARQQEVFYQHWTGKEAFLKATGDGFARALDSFEVIPGDADDRAQLRIAHEKDEGRWSIQMVCPSEHVMCAVVAEGSGWHLHTTRVDFDPGGS